MSSEEVHELFRTRVLIQSTFVLALDSDDQCVAQVATKPYRSVSHKYQVFRLLRVAPRVETKAPC